MALDITLWDGGQGVPAEAWRTICDQVLAELGASFRPDIVRFGDGSAFNFSDTTRQAKDPRAGCSVQVSGLRINRQLCRLLFELAERARLFILIVDAPQFLRPPSLHGADLDRGGTLISDIDSAEALFRYLQPQHEGV